MSPRLLQWENWELEGLLLLFFFNFMPVQGTSALRTQTNIVENTTLMVTQTCTRQLVLDQHNKLQSHHGLLNWNWNWTYDEEKTKSLLGWKLKCCRSSEQLTIRCETLTKALQVIKHIVCFTTFSQRKIRWFETKLLLLLSQFPYI